MSINTYTTVRCDGRSTRRSEYGKPAFEHQCVASYEYAHGDTVDEDAAVEAAIRTGFRQVGNSLVCPNHRNVEEPTNA